MSRKWQQRPSPVREGFAATLRLNCNCQELIASEIEEEKAGTRPCATAFAIFGPCTSLVTTEFWLRRTGSEGSFSPSTQDPCYCRTLLNTVREQMSKLSRQDSCSGMTRYLDVRCSSSLPINSCCAQIFTASICAGELHSELSSARAHAPAWIRSLNQSRSACLFLEGLKLGSVPELQHVYCSR